MTDRPDPPPAPDESARHRIEVEVDTTLFVDAGAGSGKTTQLVARVAQLARLGVPMREIAAITFTEAAAAELRDRIRRRIADAAAEASGREREHLEAALGDIDAASLSTLHAFAQAILRRFALEAGLPPSVEVADEVSSALATQHRIDALWSALLADPTARPTMRRFLLLGLGPDDLGSLARIFNEHYDRLGDGRRRVPSPPTPVATGAMVGPLEEALALVHHCTEPSDRLAVHLDEVIAPAAAELAARDGDDAVLRLLVGGPKWSCGMGRKENWAGRKPAVVDALTRAQDERERLLDRIRDEVVTAVAVEVEAFVLGAADERRRSGRLEFHDLLVLARDLLRRDPEVRQALHESFTHLLLDEFQDTDPLQLDIVNQIAGGAAAPPEWRDAGDGNGRLFFVGDPKQSIYRFRRADVRLYGAVRDHHGAAVCQLTANFRTVPGILEWVNALFGHLMADPADHEPDFVPLAPTREPLDDLPPVTTVGGAVDLPAEAVRHHSAADLAAVLAEWHEAGRPVSTGAGGGASRPMEWDDVTVLVPSRLSVPALGDAFDAAGIPYRLETASLIWGAQEVRDVLAVLHAVHDPGDDVWVAAALRTPMLGCSDDDLAGWAAAGGRWQLWAGPPGGLDADHPVARALAVLGELHDRRWWLGPVGLIDHLAAAHSTYAFALMAGSRRDRWRRLRFLADQAQLYAETQQGDLGGFLAWAELQASDVVRVSSPVLPEPDQRAVRVMTIHAAKGLEFGIVALFGLSSTPRRGGRGARVVWHSEGHWEVAFGSKGRTEDFDSLVPAEEQMDDAERLRLLYVAATRARDRLIVCLHHKATGASGCYAARIEEAMAATAVPHWSAWTGTPPSLDRATAGPPRPRAPDDPDVQAARDARDRFVAGRRALLAEPRTVWSATAVARARDEGALDDEGAAIDADADDQRVWRRGRAGTSIGRAVHGTLQLADVDHPESLAGIARSQAEVEGIAGLADTVVSLARAAFDAPVLRELLERRHWREMYVAAPVGASVVEGYVDLLAEDAEGGLVVLDYKTDSVAGAEEVAERTTRYRLQAATYALAVEAVTGRRVSRALFLFVGAGGAVPAEVDDLGAAKAEVLAVLDDPP